MRARPAATFALWLAVAVTRTSSQSQAFCTFPNKAVLSDADLVAGSNCNVTRDGSGKATAIAGALIIQHLSAAQSISLQQLVNITPPAGGGGKSEVFIYNNSNLVTISLPALRRVTCGVGIKANGRLATLNVPSLQAIDGPTVWGSVSGQLTLNLDFGTVGSNTSAVSYQAFETDFISSMKMSLGATETLVDGVGAGVHGNSTTVVSFTVVNTDGNKLTPGDTGYPDLPDTTTAQFATNRSLVPQQPYLQGHPLFNVTTNKSVTLLDLGKVATKPQLSIQENAQLTNLSFPALETIGGQLELEDCPALVELSVPVLTRAMCENYCKSWDSSGTYGSEPVFSEMDGGLRAIRLGVTTLHFPALLYTSKLKIKEVDYAVSAEFPKLIGSIKPLVRTPVGWSPPAGMPSPTGGRRRLGSDAPVDFAGVEGVDVKENANLTSLLLDSLVGAGKFEAEKCPLLANISVPAATLFWDEVKFSELGKLTNLSFPSLVTLWGKGAEMEQNPLLESISFPQLKFVGENLAIAKNPQLRCVSLPTLERAGLAFEKNPSLARLFAPAVTTLVVGDSKDADMWNDGNPRKVTGGKGQGLRVTDCTSLESIEFPSLVSIWGRGYPGYLNSSWSYDEWSCYSGSINCGNEFADDFLAGLHFSGNSALHTVHMPQLETVRGSIVALSNQKLQRFEFSQLKSVSNMLTADQNTGLSCINATSLTSVGAVVLTLNPALGSFSSGLGSAPRTMYGRPGKTCTIDWNDGTGPKTVPCGVEINASTVWGNQANFTWDNSAGNWSLPSATTTNDTLCRTLNLTGSSILGVLEPDYPGKAESSYYGVVGAAGGISFWGKQDCTKFTTGTGAPTCGGTAFVSAPDACPWVNLTEDSQVASEIYVAGNLSGANLTAEMSAAASILRDKSNPGPAVQLVSAFAMALNSVARAEATSKASLDLRELLVSNLFDLVNGTAVSSNLFVASSAALVQLTDCIPEQMTVSALANSFGTLDVLASAASNVTIKSQQNATKLLQATSNLLQLLPSKRSPAAAVPGYATLITNAAQMAAKAIATTIPVGQPSIQISTAGFKVVGQRDSAAGFEGRNITVSNSPVSVAIPSGSFAVTTQANTPLTMVLVDWTWNPRDYSDPPRTPTDVEPVTMGSAMLSLTFYQGDDELHLRGLKSPLLLYLAVLPNVTEQINTSHNQMTSLMGQVGPSAIPSDVKEKSSTPVWFWVLMVLSIAIGLGIMLRVEILNQMVLWQRLACYLAMVLLLLGVFISIGLFALPGSETWQQEQSTPTQPIRQVQCSYWNTSQSEWVLERAAVSFDKTSIQCEFDHTTDFGAHVGPEPRFNMPCYSCLSQLWSNPAGLFVVLVCALVMIATAICAVMRYSRYVSKSQLEIAQSQFAVSRRRVLNPKVETGAKETVIHRLKHDLDCGGIFCNLDGDPFDFSQRAFVFMATLVISLTVSLFLFRSPKPECSEVCTQQDQTGQMECEVVCEDPATDGLYATIVSAAITVPLAMSITALFGWLHKPVITHVEHSMGHGLKNLLRMLVCGHSASAAEKQITSTFFVSMLARGKRDKSTAKEAAPTTGEEADESSSQWSRNPKLARAKHMVLAPLGWGLLLGAFGIITMGAIASRLGPDSTRLWLLSALLSLLIKVCVVDPLKIVGTSVGVSLLQRLHARRGVAVLEEGAESAPEKEKQAQEGGEGQGAPTKDQQPQQQPAQEPAQEPAPDEEQRGAETTQTQPLPSPTSAALPPLPQLPVLPPLAPAESTASLPSPRKTQAERDGGD